MFLTNSRLVYQKWAFCSLTIVNFFFFCNSLYANSSDLSFEAISSTDTIKWKKANFKLEPLNLGPTAVAKAKFSINDSTQCLSGNKFIFQNTSSIDAGTLTYFWNFGDAITTTLKDPTHTYLYPGNYTVKLVVTGSLGGKDSTTIVVSVYDVPKSKFSLNDSTQCQKGNAFILTNQSTTFSGDNLSYLWKFGDNKSETNVNPIHTYDSAGNYKLKLLSISKDGCIDSSFIDVVVYSTPKPSFSVNDTIQSFIGNNFIFNNLTKFSGSVPKYEWRFGDDSISLQNSPGHSYKKFGLYNVTLVAKVEATGCADSSKLQIQVLPSATAKFSIKDSIQCLSENKIQLLDSSTVDAGDIIYSWNFGDGDSSNSKSPQHQYRDTGSYKITLIVNGTLGGSDTAIKFIAVKPMPKATFKLDTALQCFKGNSFVFTDSSLISSGRLTNLWLFGDNDTSRLVSPVHSYAKSGVYSPTLIVTSDFGCKDSAKVFLEVLGEVKSIFSINDSTQCFKGNLFKFQNKSKTIAGTTDYLWLFGDDSTSTIINPDHQYFKEGNFNVSLITQHSSGCKDSAAVPLRVYPSPEAKFSINDSSQTLTDNDFILTNLSKISSGNLSYQWYFGDTSSPIDIINPRYQYDTVGTYTVTLVATSIDGCIDSSSVGVLIFGTVKAKCTVNKSEQCLTGNSFEFTSESSINGGTISYLWDFGDSLNAQGQNAVHRYSSPGTYNVKLLATSSAGGKDSAFLTVRVDPMPTANFMINDSLQCITDNKFVFLNASSIENNPPPSSLWYLGDSSISISQNIVYSYLQSGVYNVKLISISTAGCRDSISKQIEVGAKPNGILYDSILTRKAFSTELNARKFENANYQWIPSALLNNDTIRSPLFYDSSQEKSRKYLIKIADKFGCVFYDTLKIFFFTKTDIIAPNAFTPNGDRLNDVFHVITYGLKELKFIKIYNRWGTLVFKTSDFKTGWDGTYKGAFQPMDTYTWIAVGVDIDGKSVSKTGNFLLIK